MRGLKVKEVCCLKHPAHVDFGQFSPDGAMVLTAGGGKAGQGAARLWDARTGRPLSEWVRHEGDLVCGAALLPDASAFVTVGKDRRVVLSSVPEGRLLAENTEHKREIWDVAVSSAGLIATASDDETVRLWDASLRPVGEVLRHPRAALRVRFDARGKLLAVVCQGTQVLVWTVPSCRLACPPLVHPMRVTAAAFLPSGRQLLTGCDDKIVRLWDLGSGKCRAEVCRAVGWIYDLLATKDGRRFVASAETAVVGKNWAGEARFWSLKGKTLVGPLGHKGTVTMTRLSPDESLALTVSQDKTAKLWDAKTGDLLHTFRHGGAVSWGCFRPDGKAILVCSTDKTSRVSSLRG
jgi:WD40 repeat protein